MPVDAVAKHMPLSATVLAILIALSAGEKHGYAILKDAARDSGLSLGPGTLYGSLDRLLRDRLVEETGVTDDERRRYYRMTALGAEVLAAESDRLRKSLASAGLSGRREAVRA